MYNSSKSSFEIENHSVPLMRSPPANLKSEWQEPSIDIDPAQVLLIMALGLWLRYAFLRVLKLAVPFEKPTFTKYSLSVLFIIKYNISFYLFPFVVITLYHHYGKKSIGKLHKDSIEKIAKTVNYAKSCPGAAARGQLKWGMAKPRG